MYIVMHRSAHMPASVKSPYRRIAVVKLRAGFVGEPTMISKRARGIEEIVKTYERRHAGCNRDGNTAFNHALAEARGLAAELNGAPTSQRSRTYKGCYGWDSEMYYEES